MSAPPTLHRRNRCSESDTGMGRHRRAWHPLANMFLSVLKVVFLGLIPVCSAVGGSQDQRSTRLLPKRSTESPPSKNPDPASSSPSTSNSTPTSTTTAFSTTASPTHSVIVGKGDHKFEPDTTTAEVGDIVEFQFFPSNHSVVRAEYGYPCIPYEMTGENKTGFFSGFRAVDSISDDPPTWSIVINSTDPIFFYCSAPGSCDRYGMVGVINPTPSTPLSNQRSLALNASYVLSPGEPFPAESAISSSTASSASASASASASISASHGSPRTLPPGAIAGIALGSVVVISLVTLLFFFMCRSRSLKAEVSRNSGTMQPPSPFRPHGMRTSNVHGHPHSQARTAQAQPQQSVTGMSPTAMYSKRFSPPPPSHIYHKPLPPIAPLPSLPSSAQVTSQTPRRPPPAPSIPRRLSRQSCVPHTPRTPCEQHKHSSYTASGYTRSSAVHSLELDVPPSPAILDSPVLGRSGSNPDPSSSVRPAAAARKPVIRVRTEGLR